MDVTLPNGSLMEFPDGTPQDIIDKYIERYHPAEPNIAERTIGHLSKGVGRALEMVENFSQYSGMGVQEYPYQKQGRDIQEFFTDNKYANQVKAYPETSIPGQLLAGAVEFAPQMPIYTVGGGAAIRGATLIPKVGKYAEALLAKGSTPIRDWGKAVARGTIEGGVVGTTIGVKPGTEIGERLKEGGGEAVGFGVAVGMLHPALKGMGYVGKGIWRRLGKKATPENLEAELAKKAETDPEAAKDLEQLRTNRKVESETKTVDEDLLVPRGETVEIKKVQGELELEPTEIPKEMIEKFEALGYKEAELADKTDEELFEILQKGIVNDKKNEPGIPGTERVGEAVEQGRPLEVAGEAKVETSGDVQAPKGEAAKEAGTVATDNEIANQGIAEALGIKYNGKMGRAGREVFLFTEPTYGATFSVKAGEDIGAKLSAKIKEFEAAGNQPVAASIEPTSEHNMRIADKRTPESTQRLMRMGYRPEEIKKMKESDAQKIFDDYKKNEAEAMRIIAEKKAKGKELITKVEEKQAAKVDEPPIEKEIIAEDLQKKLEDVDPEDFDTAADIIDNLRRLDDPMMNKILDEMPKTDEEIELAARRELIEKRAKATAKVKGAKADAPKTREELEKFLAERRRKRDPEASKKKKQLQEEWEKKLREEEGLGEPEDFIIIERDREESVREIDLENESRTYEDIEDGVYLDFMGLQQIFNLGKKIVAGLRSHADAPSTKIISEVNGRTLTKADEAEFVEGSVGQMAANSKEFWRFKGMSPDFAVRNNEKLEPLVTNMHLKFFDANFAASKRNEVVRIAHTMVPDKAEQLLIKPYLERGKWEKELAEVTGDVANLNAKLTLTKSEAKWLAKAPEKIKQLEKKITEENARVYPEHVVKAAELIKKELADVREKYKGYLRDQMHRSLNEDENAALAEILGGKPIEEVIAKYKEHVVVEGKVKQRRVVRKWVDEAVIRDIVKDYENIDKWGLDDYITHFERGPFRIVSGGKLYAKAVSVEDAARKFEKLVEMYPDQDFKLDTSHNLEGLATGISRKSYALIVNNLQKGIMDAVEGMNSSLARRAAEKGLENRFWVKPAKEFSPFVLERHEHLQGEENVFDVLYHYFYSMEKKIALDPAIDDIRRAISKKVVRGTELYKDRKGNIKERDIVAPYLSDSEAKFLENYVGDIKGRLYKEDELVDALFRNSANPRLYSRAVQTSRELQANLKLGYAPVKGFINGASALGHVWTKVGTKYIKDGTTFLQTAEGKKFIKDMEPYLGINIVESATGELSTKGFYEKIGLLKPPKTKAGRIGHAVIEPLGLFQAPELPMRKLTLAANYLMAKNDGLSEEAARMVAIKANWFQQFTYDMASLPELMRSPTGRLLMQFKPYLLKEMEFISTLRGPEIARYMAMQIALGGPRGLVMIGKSLPFLSAWYGWTEAENWANKNYPRASRGIGGALGVDITAAATFQLPSRWQDWVGPTISDLMALSKNVLAPSVANGINYMTGGGPESMVQVEGGKAIKSVFPIARHWANIWEQVVDKDGWVKDERGRRQWHIDEMSTFMAKSVAGAEPIELNRLRVAEYNMAQEKFKIGDQKVATIDSILDTIAKGEAVEQSQIDEMVRLGIKPSTLRRAAKFRVLDPKMRRLLMTEIIRRPEILEEYPDAADLE